MAESNLLIDNLKDIGFTGKRDGMSPQQIELLVFYLKLLKVHLIRLDRKDSSIRFHHGMCIGSDEGFHSLVRNILPDSIIIGHPPINTNLMMRCKSSDFDEMREPKDYLIRNHDIVDESQILISTPNMEEETRSGTWATVRYARKTSTPIIILQ